MWDTFALFEELLRSFGTHLRRARRIRSAGPEGSYQFHVAISGFLDYGTPAEWGQPQFRYVMSRLDGDYSLESLQWFEEAAPAVQAFACLALGSLLGKYSAGQIDDPGLMLGEMHLTAFLFDRSEGIDDRYTSEAPSPLSEEG